MVGDLSMTEAGYDHVAPRTDAEVAADEAKAKKATAKNKARKTTEPATVKSK